jgi:hypothetical protein
LLIDEDYSTEEIEKILSVKIGYVERYKKMYLKGGLKELLEGDINNLYKVFFEMKNHGWMDLCIEFRGLIIKINLSSVFDPIPDLLNLIIDINNGKEIMSLKIDEEGHYKKIIMKKINIFNNELYEIKILSDNFPFNEYEFKKIIYKDIFLNKVMEAFIKLADENRETEWTNNYNLSELIYSTVKNIKEGKK